MKKRINLLTKQKKFLQEETLFYYLRISCYAILGIILIILSLLVGSVLLYYTATLTNQAQELGCYSSPSCSKIEQTLSFSHIAVGIFSFMLALGFYLLFFNKTEKIIMERLERDKEEKIGDAKFEMLLKALDSFEDMIYS